KDVLDFYTCKECGRCSDNCPAFITGKILRPKHFTLDLRDHLYALQAEVMRGGGPPRGTLDRPAETTAADEGAGWSGTLQGGAGEVNGSASKAPGRLSPVDLVPHVIHEDVLWGCTTCRACEELCPVLITCVDNIVQMRRNLVVMRGELPSELN